MTYHFVSLTVKIPALLRHLREVKAHALARADEGVLIKTAFAESFGEGNWPKPFVVRRRGHDGSYEILGYSKRSPEELASIYSPIPSLAEAVPLSSIRGYPLTAPAAGTELRFYTTICPMIRGYSCKEKGIRGRERDAYTVETEKAKAKGRDPRERMQVYHDFLSDRMMGVELLSAQPIGFSFTKVLRGKERKHPEDDDTHRFAVPSVTFSGILRVTDPADFLQTITTGIGRQRTYGYGMILLGAAAPREDVTA
jgi:CRISPR system Cascade subunit CasE